MTINVLEIVNRFYREKWSATWSVSGRYVVSNVAICSRERGRYVVGMWPLCDRYVVGMWSVRLVVVTTAVAWCITSQYFIGVGTSLNSSYSCFV